MKFYHLALVSTVFFSSLALAQTSPDHKIDPFEKPADPAYVAPSTSKPEVKTDAGGLQQALVNTYNTNPILKAARESQAALDEQIAYASAGYRPDIRAGVGTGRDHTKMGNSPKVSSTPKDASLTASQPLFRGGRTLADMQSANKRVEAGRAQLLGTEQTVLFSAVNAYSDVVEKQSVLELNKSNVNVLSKQLEVTKARFDVGELTRTDLAQAEARLKQAEADARQAEGDLNVANAGFERVIGYKPENLLTSCNVPELPQTLDDARAQAQALNPGVVAATNLEEAAKYTARGAYGALLPEVTLDGGISRGKENFQGLDYDNESLMLNVTIPLYQSGREYARIRESTAQKKEAQFRAMDAKLSATESATKAFEDYQASLSVIESTKSSIAASEVARDGVKQENEFGVRTIIDVLDAEQELFRAKVNLVRAERVSALQAYNLLAATGKLTAKYLKLPVEYYDAEAGADFATWAPLGF